MHSTLAVQSVQNSFVTSVFIYIGYERISADLHFPKPKTWTNTIMVCNLICGRLVNLGIQWQDIWFFRKEGYSGTWALA